MSTDKQLLEKYQKERTALEGQQDALAARLTALDSIINDGQCLSCDGEGGYHDCGDDTCCCAADGEDDPDWVDCADCGGSGLR